MKYLINLLPDKEQYLSDKIIFFSFHYLRYILVITQFIAICVFFYRFKVDQEIVDLRDSLKQKRIIVDSTKDLLKEVDRLDTKMSIIKQMLTSQKKIKDIYTYLFTTLSSPIIINRFSYEPDSIEVHGSSNAISSIQTAYQKIKQEKKFQDVALNSIIKEQDGYTFSLLLKLY